MSNWFEQNATKAVISYTVVVMAATWATSTFILDENKINLHKAEASNAQAMAEQYKAKISVLEGEIATLKEENKKYYTWLTQDPKSIPALENRIADLESALDGAISNLSKDSLSKDSVGAIGNTSKSIDAPLMDEIPSEASPVENKVPSKPYQFTKTFTKGESFIDTRTSVSLGINAIHSDYTASGQLNLPDRKTAIDFDKVKPGQLWKFEHEGVHYMLTLNRVNWINNRLEATIVELTQAN